MIAHDTDLQDWYAAHAALIVWDSCPECGDKFERDGNDLCPICQSDRDVVPTTVETGMQHGPERVHPVCTGCGKVMTASETTLTDTAEWFCSASCAYPLGIPELVANKATAQAHADATPIDRNGGYLVKQFWLPHISGGAHDADDIHSVCGSCGCGPCACEQPPDGDTTPASILARFARSAIDRRPKPERQLRIDYGDGSVLRSVYISRNWEHAGYVAISVRYGNRLTWNINNVDHITRIDYANARYRGEQPLWQREK